MPQPLKFGEPTKRIAVRVPISRIKEAKEAIEKALNQFKPKNKQK